MCSPGNQLRAIRSHAHLLRLSRGIPSLPLKGQCVGLAKLHTKEKDISIQDDKPGTGGMSALSPGKEMSQAQGPFLQG